MSDFFVNVGDVGATDTFPSAVVEKRDLVAP